MLRSAHYQTFTKLLVETLCYKKVDKEKAFVCISCNWLRKNGNSGYAAFSDNYHTQSPRRISACRLMLLWFSLHQITHPSAVTLSMTATTVTLASVDPSNRSKNKQLVNHQ